MSCVLLARAEFANRVVKWNRPTGETLAREGARTSAKIKRASFGG